MNKKLIFRILGAVSSALIIVSLFIPFVSISGYTQNLWEDYSNIDALYLPIMIIAFGAIGVLVFSLNIKTEIAYSTAGALLFYLITKTISFIDQDMMKTLSVGYYCLVIGTLLTGIMAFLCNLRTKQKVVNVVEPQENPVSIFNQIDALYNNQSENMVQPIGLTPNMPEQVQPIGLTPNMPEQVQPIGLTSNMSEQVQPIGLTSNMSEQVQPIGLTPNMPEQVQPIGLTSNMSEQVQPIGLTSNMSEQVQPIGLTSNMPEQVQSMALTPNMPMQAQPTVQIPDVPTTQINNNVDSSLNPIVTEFSTPIAQKDVLSQTSNPVINEFTSSTNTVLPETPVKVEPKVEPASNNLDIFN